MKDGELLPKMIHAPSKIALTTISCYLPLSIKNTRKKEGKYWEDILRKS